MAVKVQEMLTRFYVRVDPQTDDMTWITSANVGTVDGQSFPKQAALNVYNDARRSIASVMRVAVPHWFMARTASGLLIRKTDLAFTSGVANVPDGYIQAERLTDNAGGKIIVTTLDRVGAIKDFESASKRYVLDLGNTFATESGTTYVPNASNYVLWYFGVKDWALADVTGGTALKTFNELWHVHIIEVANMIANEVGQAEITEFIGKFFRTVQSQLSAAGG